MNQYLLRWEEMRPRLIATLITRGWSEADAEDLFSSALIKAAERLDALNDPDAAESWFWSLALRHAIDERRRQQRRPIDKSVDLEFDQLQAPEPPPNVCACSVQLLDDLPARSRDILKSVDYHGEAVQDYAHRADITPNNASVRLFRARKALRSRLADCCQTTSVSDCMDCGC